RHERGDRLAFELVRTADDGGLGNRGMADERAFDLHRTDAVARNVHHVVDAAHDPQVSVRVHARAVTGEVLVAEAAPVVLHIAVRIAVDGPQHAGPRLAYDQEAALVRAALVAVRVDDRDVDAGKRNRARPRLGRDGARHRRDHDSAGFGLPPRVDDRAAPAADGVAVPHPRFRIDRLA